ncbi:hypothetical protein SD427_14635 [Chryseobacterium sp. JJR-5R]|uniref:hypothetical protein n=1 Tax=Chryseobacterium sp. JJR-5R TaxID=3093923 RepID=UPI002A758B94|nr:hypothetical protein [Chryseobacterium sp. JJR-5R]WPO81992.1 hypothetical protein SD427_14635 [Chryseobacterium sp. JJR-5R]
MSRKGISKISGNPSPKVGEKTIYTIAEWYPATPEEKRNPALVTWELFKRRSNGQFTTTNLKKKGDGSFTFGEVSQKHTYRLEAYLYKPEGKGAMTIDINPQPNEVPKIGKLDLHYSDNTKGNVFSFTEKLVAKAHCVNMRGMKLNFMLWEDDAKGKGHASGNLLIDSKQAYVERNGLATAEFMLTKALMKKAMEGEADIKQLEFYVTVEYYKHKKHATDNVEVKNPFPPLKHEIPAKPTNIPKAKGSPAASKFPSEKEERGIGDMIADKAKELWDWWETSGTIKKDQPVRKPDPGGRSVTIVKNQTSDQQEKEKCFCNRDFEEKDVRQFVKLLKGSETIWEGQALKGGKRATCHINDKSFAALTKGINSAFRKYNINTCAQKMHFLAQACEETGTFTLSEETKSDFLSSQSIYKGRGLLQLTGVKKKGEKFYDNPGPYKNYADYKRNQDIVKNPSIIADNVDYCIDSGAWIWSVNKKMPEAPSPAVDKWGAETSGKSLNELAIYVDKYLELISVLLNGRNKAKGNMPNGWAARKSNYELLKTGFFIYQRYHKDNNTSISTKNIVTYHIYSGGKIEKHIPKKIKEEYRKKYKYVYHKNGKEHELGSFHFKKTKEMNKGNIVGNDYIELIDIREFDGYESSEVKIKFLTLNTDSKRYYINPDCYAGLLGAMADMNINYLGFNGFSNFEAKSTGGSSSHRNGEKGDLRYLSKNKKGEATILQDAHFDISTQNKFNNALYNFGWGKLEKMYSEYFNNSGNKNYLLNHTKHMRKDGKKGYRHYHHLHLTGFDHSIVRIIKE